MSGIAGFYHFDGRPAHQEGLRRMVDRLAHRGPDGVATWCSESAGLGHCMLHTTPESFGEQFPLVNPRSSLALTADVRIDNRDELIALLRPPKPAGRPITDGELLLGAYEKWGAACPEKLLGDFAFVIWDGREQRLFCARDHFGVKPFYYCLQPGRRFAFGSEIKALFCLDGIPRVPSELGIAYYLAQVADFKGFTFFEDIVSLPPAHSMTIDRDGVLHQQRYWSLDPERALRLGSDAAYAEGFLDVFTEAVRSRLRAPTTPGVMMSGGLDSTSVACIARRELASEGRGPLPTFSAIFPNLPEEYRSIVDEQPYIEAVQQQGGIQAHLVPLDEVSPLTDIDRALWHLDAPALISNIYLIRSLYQTARRQGVRVVLDGAEGDVVISHGTAYLDELAFGGQWGRFAEESVALTEKAGVAPKDWFRRAGTPFLARHARLGRWRPFFDGTRVVAERFGLSRRYLLWQCGVKPRIPASVRRAWRMARRRNTSKVPAIIAQALAKRTDFEARLHDLRRPSTPVAYTERAAHWYELESSDGTIGAILAQTNHLAAGLGVEERHPFYDPRLASYCLALPPEQKLHQGWTRMILRRAMEGILPESVRWRTDKADLSPSFFRNLFRMEQATLDQLVTDDLDRLAPYVDLAALRKARERKNGHLLWTVLILSRWLRQAQTNSHPVEA